MNETKFLTGFTEWTGFTRYSCAIALIYGFRTNPENRENPVNPVKNELAHGYWIWSRLSILILASHEGGHDSRTLLITPT